ncbi:hypothetical protein CEXT_399961 [Caerostris extrusa]|uniref:F-box/LRR-repeat protein 15-like leucin rich repeat domain-containing protein n=1 Tax=Caerostris extrusa TaxID=172846 RepID=A0AAV4PID4_CAEEX|nr:hypothetical protein CEXT_399961 [Caerostris extrusa]
MFRTIILNLLLEYEESLKTAFASQFQEPNLGTICSLKGVLLWVIDLPLHNRFVETFLCKLIDVKIISVNFNSNSTRQEASQAALPLRQASRQPDREDLLLPVQQRAGAHPGGQGTQDALQAPVPRLAHPLPHRRAHQPQRMLRLTDKGLATIALKCPELKVLELKGCTWVSSRGVTDIVSRCHSLEKLDLTGCNAVTSVHSRPPSLDSTTITPNPFRLRYLDLTDCQRLDDSGLERIVRHFSQLTHLYLRRCILVTDEGLKGIANYCVLLRELSVSDCVLLTDFGLYELAKLGANMRYLSVAKCDRISDAGVKQIARHCYKLRYLNVRGCEAVSDDALEVVARSCSKLRALDIGKCDITDRGLRVISHHCPNLRKLSLKSCEMITDEGIQIIAYYCRGLQQLNVQDCPITLDGYRTVKKFCKRCIIEHTNPGFN